MSGGRKSVKGGPKETKESALSAILGTKRRRKDRKEQANPEEEREATESVRLKEAATAVGMVSVMPADPLPVPLAPHPSLVEIGTTDIFKKPSARKNRFLLALPGAFAFCRQHGGRIGRLCRLNTQNPILYIVFPEGRLRLRGVVACPRNKLLSLVRKKSVQKQDHGARHITCDHVFDVIILFSDAVWIGTEEENPSERPLPFPKGLTEPRRESLTFEGGAGVHRSPVERTKSSIMRDRKAVPVPATGESFRSRPQPLNVIDLDSGSSVDADFGPPADIGDGTLRRRSERHVKRINYAEVEGSGEDEDDNESHLKESAEGQLEESVEDLNDLETERGVRDDDMLGRGSKRLRRESDDASFVEDIIGEINAAHESKSAKRSHNSRTPTGIIGGLH